MSDEIDGDDLTMLPEYGDAREVASIALRSLQEDMDETEWVEFTVELDKVVIEQTLRELELNFNMETESPVDSLNRDLVVGEFEREIGWIWEHDQTSKTHEVMKFILDEAEKRGVVEVRDGQ